MTLAIATTKDLHSEGCGLEEIAGAYQAYTDPEAASSAKQEAETIIARCISVALLRYAVAPEEFGVEPGLFPEFANADSIDIRRVYVTADGIHFLVLANSTLRQGYVHTQDEFQLQIR